MKLDGGVGSVRVVPINMKQGGDPAEKLLAEGPPEGPKQFKLPDERMLTKRKQIELQPIPVPDDKPMSSEPDFDADPKKPAFPGPGMKMEEFLFTTPTINPMEVFPRDPDPFIQGFFDPMPEDRGGIPNLMDANMLKPAGILTINKSYDI